MNEIDDFMLETEYFRRAEQNEMTIRHKQSTTVD